MSAHVLLTANIHITTNKEKIMVVLDSSKTHDKSMRPQQIKIVATNKEHTGSYLHRHFCPFKILQEYMKMRGDYYDDDKQFFVFSDKSPVKPTQTSSMLKSMIAALGLDAS